MGTLDIKPKHNKIFSLDQIPDEKTGSIQIHEHFVSLNILIELTLEKSAQSFFVVPSFFLQFRKWMTSIAISVFKWHTNCSNATAQLKTFRMKRIQQKTNVVSHREMNIDDLRTGSLLYNNSRKSANVNLEQRHA